ncbi:MAG: hypothetical protein Q4G14_11460 [Paracoccus sp. (in: a-proteobacteria)]|uniref:hypothetical protein n=1 Tax=Paracoccus sp. TaxID=267 RepID=UPI0026E0634E|nr:hypothetical protein [Paracoccus sp. (in: a-proteobacteria)]MDO5613840.1 hypothetical protein [Paracoccus sp. (in: a-proteobacteria)]
MDDLPLTPNIGPAAALRQRFDALVAGSGAIPPGIEAVREQIGLPAGRRSV